VFARCDVLRIWFAHLVCMWRSPALYFNLALSRYFAVGWKPVQTLHPSSLNRWRFFAKTWGTIPARVFPEHLRSISIVSACVVSLSIVMQLNLALPAPVTAIVKPLFKSCVAVIKIIEKFRVSSCEKNRYWQAFGVYFCFGGEYIACGNSIWIDCALFWVRDVSHETPWSW